MLTKVTVETALNVELDEHLGYEKHSKPSSNSRNGYSTKSIITDDGEVPIDVPRDRESSFERLCCVIKFKDRTTPFRVFLNQYDKF